MIQSFLYLMALQAFNFEKVLRKNRVYQAQVLYGLLVIALAYLVGSFFCFFIH